MANKSSKRRQNDFQRDREELGIRYVIQTYTPALQNRATTPKPLRTLARTDTTISCGRRMFLGNLVSHVNNGFDRAQAVRGQRIV